jgi:hypothetical protein
MFKQVSQSLDRGLHDSLQTYGDALRQLAEKQQQQLAVIVKA